MVWGMFSAAGVGHLTELHEYMQKFIRTVSNSIQVLSCGHPLISHQLSCRIMSSVTQQNNVMASPESGSNPNSKPEAKLWLRNPLQSLNCERD